MFHFHRRQLLRFTLTVLSIALSATGTVADPAPGRALIEVSISPEGRVKASLGEAKPVLVHRAWTEFDLVIDNTAGLTTPLAVESKQLMKSEDDGGRDRWVRVEIVPSGPLTGQGEEKRTLRLWSRDAGRRAAVFNVNAGQGSQDLGFRSDVLVTFVIKPAASR